MFYEVEIRYSRAAAYQIRYYTAHSFIRNSSIKCIHIRRLLNKFIRFSIRVCLCDSFDYYYYYYYYYHYYLLQLSFHPVAVVLALVQTKQIRIHILAYLLTYSLHGAESFLSS